MTRTDGVGKRKGVRASATCVVNERVSSSGLKGELWCARYGNRL